MKLPNNVEAERAFLSLLLKTPSLVKRFDGVIFAADFYEHANEVIYSSMLRLADSRKPITVISVTQDLREDGSLHEAGGIANITAIQALTETVNADPVFLANGYADIIADCATQRQGVRAFATAAQRVTAGDDLEAILADVQSDIRGAERNQDSEMAGVDTLQAEWSEWYAVTKEKGTCPGIDTGFPLLTHITGGWQDSTLVILGARPGMGKTALALNFAAEACRGGKSVAFFSLEMTRRELVSRLIAYEGGVNAGHANIPALLTPEETKAVDVVFDSINKWRLHIDDSYAIPVPKIAAKSRRLKNASGLDLVIVDHLNYIGNDGKSENRTNEMRKITSSLKGLAKELKIPVIVLCQLSRGIEGRNNKRPVLADLRESGTIEQDADLVLFLYRDSYYSKDANDKSAELEIAKHRGGAVGRVAMKFDGLHQRFTQTENLFWERVAKEEVVPA